MNSRIHLRPAGPDDEDEDEDEDDIIDLDDVREAS